MTYFGPAVIVAIIPNNSSIQNIPPSPNTVPTPEITDCYEVCERKYIYI